MSPYLSILLLAATGFAVYANALFNGFVWDDELRILNNPLMRDPANWRLLLSGESAGTATGSLSGGFFRPLLALVNLGLFTVSGPHALGFHLAQVITHVVNGVLLFLLLQRLNRGGRAALGVNTVISALFITHAAIAEAVLYISAGEVLYVTFVLAVLNLMAYQAGRLPGPVRLAAAAACLLLALLYKESALVALPLLGSYLFLYRPRGWPRWGVALTAAFVCYLGLRLALLGTRAAGPQELTQPGTLSGLWTFPLEAVTYLQLLLFPADLIVARNFTVTPGDLRGFIAPALVLVAGGGLLLTGALRLRSRLVWLGLSWFVPGLAWASGPFPQDLTIAERWLYAPLAGGLIAAAGAVTWLLEGRPGLTKPVFAGLAVWSIALGIRTVDRSFDWRDAYTLFSHDVQYTNASTYLEHNLGVELVRRGQNEDAKQHFQRSIEIDPYFTWGYNSLGGLYERSGDYEEARKFYEKSVAIRGYDVALNNLALLLLTKLGDPQQARIVARRGVERHPASGALWFTLALCEYSLGDREAALRAAERARRLDPSDRIAEFYSLLASNVPIRLR